MSERSVVVVNIPTKIVWQEEHGFLHLTKIVRFKNWKEEFFMPNKNCPIFGDWTKQ